MLCWTSHLSASWGKKHKRSLRGGGDNKWLKGVATKSGDLEMPSVTSQRASVLHKDRRGSYRQRQVLVHGLQSRTTAAQVRHTILDHLTSQNTFLLQKSTVGEGECKQQKITTSKEKQKSKLCMQLPIHN